LSESALTIRNCVCLDRHRTKLSQAADEKTIPGKSIGKKIHIPIGQQLVFQLSIGLQEK
jgi:hypothetical protein